MKKILMTTLLLTSLCFAQTEKSSLLELRSKLDVSFTEENSLFQIELSPEKKKPGVAILYSFLLPGMGELYADGYDSGVYFTAADVAIWGAVFGFNIYGNWQKDNYMSFAEMRGGITAEGKSDQFYSDISGYLNVEEFNNEKYLNRDFGEVYNTTTHYWSWASQDVRREYRNMWSSSEQAFTNVRFAIGALILNRIVSMINAVRVVNIYNKKLESESLPKLSLGIEYDPNFNPYLSLNLRKMF